MTDQWDGWPDDGLPDEADTTDLSGDGYDEQPLELPGFDESDDAGWDSEPEPGLSSQEGFGRDLPGAPGAGDPMGVLGYGDEPLEVPDGVAGFGEAGEVGFGPAGHAHGAGDGLDDGDGGEVAEHSGTGQVGDVPVGADPDLTGGEPGMDQPLFPQPLDLAGLPDPVDGFPWIDVDLIGAGVAGPLPDLLVGLADAPGLDELLAYAGQALPAGESGWAALLGSPDPATSTLARFWAPGR